MFDFRRIALFCLEKRLSKHKMTMFSKNLGGALPPPRLCLWSVFCWVFQVGHLIWPASGRRKWLYFLKIWGVHSPPPGYAYDLFSVEFSKLVTWFDPRAADAVLWSKETPFRLKERRYCSGQRIGRGPKLDQHNR